MKNITLIVFCLLLKSACLCQDTIKISLKELNDTTVYSVLKKRDSFISNLADSLNNYEKGELPFYLSMSDFDYIYSDLWDGNHQPVCLRKMIFEKTNNKKVLKNIIRAKNKNYKNVSERKLQIYGTIKIPFQDVSNRDFAKKRLKELQHK